jgi:putative DNA primase/helicase
LRDARVIWCTETEKKGGVDQVFFKQLTGNDQMSGRHNYGEQQSFTTAGKLIITTNVMPDWLHDDEALWRRVKVLPFNRTFTAKSGRNNDLDEILALEASGILRWMVHGAFEYLRDGFDEPAEVIEATRKARREADSVHLWLKTECVKRKGRYLEVQIAYDAYVKFAKSQKVTPVSQKIFKPSMERLLGGQQARTSKGRIFLVLRWYPKIFEKTA